MRGIEAAERRIDDGRQRPARSARQAPQHRGRKQLALTGGQPIWREGTVTDNGNWILDVHNWQVTDPVGLERELNQIPGVVENGLFIDICDVLIIGHGDGRVQVRDIHAGTLERGWVDEDRTDNIFADLGD